MANSISHTLMVLKTHFLNILLYCNVFPHKMSEIVNLDVILYVLISQPRIEILLGNRVNRVQHTLIMLKSQVSNFY